VKALLTAAVKSVNDKERAGLPQDSPVPIRQINFPIDRSEEDLKRDANACWQLKDHAYSITSSVQHRQHYWMRKKRHKIAASHAQQAQDQPKGSVQDHLQAPA